MAKMKIGVPIDIHYSDRYFHFQRQHAIRDVFDALVELITNCDDSYHRLYKRKLRAEDGGRILIDILVQRKESQSIVIVRDKAEGMTLQTMREKLGDVGTRRSEEGDRGFMARGAKDCTELGRMKIQSIKEDKYYESELTPKPQFIPLVNKRKVDKNLRKELHIERGNGTVVTLEIQPEHRIPRIDTIIRDLSRHFALRDILSENSVTKCLVRNLNKPRSKPEKIVYMQPEGELVCDEDFYIRGYEGAKAKLMIWKAPELFDDPNDRRFRRSGLLVKGDRAIHECSLLYPGFEKDPYAKKYFGRIECEYIDNLLNEYDKRRENNEPNPSENPALLIDPNRREGLRKEHPFTRSLFQVPSERLKALIDKEKQQDKSQQRELTSKETKKKLGDLAKAASKFLSQQIEDLQELTIGDDVDKDFFSKKGVLIYPTYFRIGIGEVRSLTFYVNRGLFDKEGEEISVAVDDDAAVVLLDTPFKLRNHPKRNDRLIGTFRIRGEKVKDSVSIRATCQEIPTAEAIVAVVENRVEDHQFISSLEFEHKTYQLKEGSTKTLRLFAKCPQLVNQETEINVNSSDSISLPVQGRCRLVPVKGTNFAVGDVHIRGRRLKKASIQIKASINGNEAIAKVKVIQKEEEVIQIKIKLLDEDFGVYRSMWNQPEQKPNELLISARHDSTRRYLGPTPDYEGQHSLHFRVLLAEIVTEAICRKSLMLEAKDRPWEFKWADLKDDDAIADGVSAQLQKRIRSFAGIAHSIMVGTSEIKQ
jgi:hypothetical protein